MEEVDLPAAILMDEDRRFQPSQRFGVGRRACASRVFPSGPRHIAAHLGIYIAQVPVDLDPVSESLENDLGQAFAFKAFAHIKGVHRRRCERFERHAPFSAQSVEKVSDGQLDICTSLLWRRALSGCRFIER